MAAEFLRGHGIDLDAELAAMQSGDVGNLPSKTVTISNASLPNTEAGTTWTIILSPEDGKVSDVRPSQSHRAARSPGTIDVQSALVAPSPCHPHIHLDKAFLLSHPSHSHLRIKKGDFGEAMSLTGKAKGNFTQEDLLERGRRVIDESVAAGVTHMRAFVELDAGVGRRCLDAGLQLKKEADGRCTLQICAFAQLPLFTASKGDEDGSVIRGLMEDAAKDPDVEALGSTPYVEDSRERMQSNVVWLVDLAIGHKKHVDFHLDYNLDNGTEPLVWHVVETLKQKAWTSSNPNRTIVLGHCTRLTIFQNHEWKRLKSDIADLPISFVGLPTSDLFMMRTREQPEIRGTLDVPRLIKDYGLNACIGINNIGNAFTPQGSCDPLTLACNGVGIYQAGTEADAQLLYECVSTRAREAIGFGRTTKDGEKADVGLNVKDGDDANLIVFGAEKEDWRTRKTIAEAVYLYDGGRGRRSIFRGRAVD